MGWENDFKKIGDFEQFAIIFKLVLKYPGKRGSDYSRLLEEAGFENVDKKTINSFLYARQKVFKPNLDINLVPSWTVIIEDKTIQIEDNNNQDVNLNQSSIKSLDILSSFKLNNWQDEALKNWMDNKKKGYIIASRRAGKTFLAQLIAFDHAINHGPVIVAVNTKKEIGEWFKRIDELNTTFNSKIRTARNDSESHDLLGDKTILLGTVSSLSKTKYKHDNILFILEHMDMLSHDNGQLFNPDYKYRLGLTNSKPDIKFVEVLTNKLYFNALIYQSDITQLMLEGMLQNYSLNFVACNPNISYSALTDFCIENALNYYPDLKKKKWIDYHNELKVKQSQGENVDYLIEVIEAFQYVESKTEYLRLQIDRLRATKRSVIFCENPLVIENIHNILDRNGVNHIIYSTHQDLAELSQSPHDWHDESVLVTDHIKYITNFEFGVVNYALIFGTLGNSSRLTSKIETIISDRDCKEKLSIDVLFLKDSIEDPYNNVEAYFDYKDYLKVNFKFNEIIVEEDLKPSNLIVKEIKTTIKINLDLTITKILFLVSSNIEDFKLQLGLLIDEMNLNENDFEVQKISTDFDSDTFIEQLNTNKYSDVFMVVSQENEILTDMQKIDVYSSYIKVDIDFEENVSLANILKFIYESKKFNQQVTPGQFS